MKKILDCEQNQAPSDFPIIEMTIPSVLDPTIAPKGKFLDSNVFGKFGQHGDLNH